ncbi:MAG: DMT family transporter, partial [Beijerinckiaceae bacterium]
MSSTNARAGIGLMCLGILLFALNDVMGKWLMSTYTVGQVLLLRSVAAMALLLPFAAKEGWAKIARPPQPGLNALRMAFGTLETACFYWAVVHLPLVSVMTYYLAAPLYVAAIAPFLLKERLDTGRWIAVLVGFIGVLIVLRPSAETLTGPALIAVVGSLLFAGLLLSTRLLKGASSTTLIVWQTGGALLLGLALAPFGWVQPTPRDFALLALLGVVAMLAHVMVAKALQLAPAAIVSPFQY